MEQCLGVVVVNKGLKMRPCSHECATEYGVDVVPVNEELWRKVKAELKLERGELI